MTSRPHTTALIIMAKAPIPGFVKTRLIPALGAEGAALLAGRMFRHTIEVACQTTVFSHLTVCVTPEISHPAFDPFRDTLIATGDSCKIEITSQGQGDLGSRMQRAFERALVSADAAVMIGTDAPCMTAADLDRAACDLQRHDAVFIPALDGGYTLIGLQTVVHEVFSGVPWSTADVMLTTRQRLASLGWRWHEYEPMADVDEPQDLHYLPTVLTT